MSLSRSLFALITILTVESGALGLDLSISSSPYLSSGLYTRPVLPIEGTEVVIGVEARADSPLATPVVAMVEVLTADGKAVHQIRLPLEVASGLARGEVTWTAGKNGLYRLRAKVDPDNALQETDESNNTAEVALPVIIKERTLFFPWYTPSECLRWANVYTSVKGADAPNLTRRGIKPLGWAYGGMSWSYFDDKRLESEPEKAMAELEAHFLKVYSQESLPNLAGFGIDETGGYPTTAAHLKSIASMKGLVAAKKKCPDRLFAVWHGGGVEPALAALHHRGADLLLLETYVWRAIPNELGIDDIYQVIRDRLDPVIRSFDMLTPAYGNPCHTLIALDTSERPDWIDPGEQEQVVRYIRRICPEMRGLAHYNSGYGGYGLTRTPETDRMREAVIRNADRLCFEYFIKPCLTLHRESLWLVRKDRQVELTAAVSNIGAIDSGPVEVQFLDGDKDLGRVTLPRVPAGGNRIRNRAMARLTVDASAGAHTFVARIISAPGATLLDGEVTEKRTLP